MLIWKIMGGKFLKIQQNHLSFADEYLVSETERIFEVTIKEPIIITVDVELPKAERTI